MSLAVNSLYLLCKMLEPFVPSFSAKVYEQMNVKNSERDEKLFEYLREEPNKFTTLISGGH